MSRQFNMEAPLFVFLTKVADIMLLNLVFILCCLPVVTVGAAWTALYYVTLKMAKNEESFVIKSYIASFRQNFRQATGIWLVILGLLAILGLDIWILRGGGLSGAGKTVLVLVGILFVWLYMVLQYLFPSLSRFEADTRTTVKNACLMALAHFPRTAVMTVFTLGAVYLTFKSNMTFAIMLFVWILGGYALLAYAKSTILVRIFERYMPNAPENPHGNTARDQGKD